MFSDHQQIFQPNIYDDGIYLYEELNAPKKLVPPITIPTNSYSPYRTIPAYRNNIEMEQPKRMGAKESFNSMPPFNGHFSLPIRSGDPDRKTISDIYSATSWDERPQSFDGNNVYNNWINKDTFSNLENSNTNNSNFLLKILLFIMLIILIVVLCIIINNHHKTNSFKKINDWSINELRNM